MGIPSGLTESTEHPSGAFGVSLHSANCKKTTHITLAKAWSSSKITSHDGSDRPHRAFTWMAQQEKTLKDQATVFIN